MPATADPVPQWLLLAVLLLAAAGYAAGVARLRRRGDRWPLRRIAAAGLGLGCLTAAAVPPLADGSGFAAHAVRHLLMAMVAPLALALSAPITLALRTFPRGPRSVLRRLLGSRWVRLATTAPAVLALEVGGMYALYLTPLYAAGHTRPWLNAVLHLHLFLAGCLFSWYLVGRDPMPAPASTRARIAVLFLAAGSHDLLAKLLYAHQLPEHGGTAEQLRLGAQIMFYGGDAVEVALAVVVLWDWYARTGRELARRRPRPAGPARA